MTFTVSMRAILDHAIKFEQGGEEFYRRIAGLTKDEKVRQVCLFFASEEREHLKIFKNMIQESNVDVEREFSANIISLMNQQIHKLKETGMQSPSFDFSSMSIQQCLELALNIELATIAIYEEIRREMDTNYNMILYKIIHEESRHVDTVEKVLKELNPKRKEAAREAKIIKPDTIVIRKIKVKPHVGDYINVIIIFLGFTALILAMVGPKYISYIICV